MKVTITLIFAAHLMYREYTEFIHICDWESNEWLQNFVENITLEILVQMGEYHKNAACWLWMCEVDLTVWG
jgi:hypothetical protein